MIEIRISGISLKIDILLHKWIPRNQFLLIDMTFNLSFRQGHPGTCLYKSNNNDQMVLRTISPIVRYFYKDMFLEFPDGK